MINVLVFPRYDNRHVFSGGRRMPNLVKKANAK
jgi:hypothetical protein